MNPENITAVIRPRSPWEAVDLGCVLVRRHYLRFLFAWCATVFPLWAVIAVLLWDSPGWAMIAIWWIKPIYDRVPLFIVSRSLFGPPPKFREILRAWPGLLFRNLFWPLTLGRIGLRRSFEMPVMQLESLRGAERRQRATVLGYEGGAQASNVTFAFLSIEFALYLALVGLAQPMLGGSLQSEIEDFFLAVDDPAASLPHAFAWFLNAVYMAAITLAEPFYVGAGFGLYLNSRTHLEGWDIELAFKSMSARLAAVRAAIVRPSAVALLALVASLCFLSPAASAQDMELEEDGIETTSETAAHILADPDFEVHRVDRKVWVSDAEPKSFDGNIDWVMTLGRVLFWIAVALLVYWLGKMIWRNRDFFLSGRRPKEDKAPERARTVLGMDVAAESLPDDIAASARALWREGRVHEALSLLYRGSLSWFVHRADLPVRESDTETDCERHADSLPEPSHRAYFSRLTATWVGLAYGGVVPPDPGMEALVDGWPFGGGEGRRS